MNDTLKVTLDLFAPVIQALATSAIFAACATGAALFNSLRHRTKQSRVEQLAWRLVTAAEQKLELVTPDQKHAYVMGLLRKEFPRIDPALLDAALQSAVAGWKNAKDAPVALPLKPEG